MKNPLIKIPAFHLTQGLCTSPSSFIILNMEPTNEDSKTEVKDGCTKCRYYEYRLEKGKTYFYCTCGLSKRNPFCDGSHGGTPFKPLPFTVSETKQYKLCTCTKSSTRPFCDKAHLNIDW